MRGSKAKTASLKHTWEEWSLTSYSGTPNAYLKGVNIKQGALILQWKLDQSTHLSGPHVKHCTNEWNNDSVWH